MRVEELKRITDRKYRILLEDGSSFVLYAGELRRFHIEEGSWEILPVFRFLEEKGNIPHREMFNIFNMGIGMVLAVSEADAGKVLSILDNSKEKPQVIGYVYAGENIIVSKK